MLFNKYSNKVIILLLTGMFITSCTPNKSILTDEYQLLQNNKYNKFINEYAQTKFKELRDINIIYFDLNKYNIKFEFAAILDEHAMFLCNNPMNRIIIEGHADERGTPEYNIALGERRANAVKMYLQSKGISLERIDIVSYGKEKPAVLGHSEEIYSKNRRAVIIY